MGNILFFALIGLAIFCMYNVICMILAKTKEEREEYTFKAYLEDFTNKIKSILGFDLDDEFDDDEDFISLGLTPRINLVNNREGPSKIDYLENQLLKLHEEISRNQIVVKELIDKVKMELNENRIRLEGNERKIKEIQQEMDIIEFVITDNYNKKINKYKDENFKIISINDYIK